MILTITLRAPGACAARAKARLQAQKWAHDNGVTLYLQNVRVRSLEGNVKVVTVTAVAEGWSGAENVRL